MVLEFLIIDAVFAKSEYIGFGAFKHILIDAANIVKTVSAGFEHAEFPVALESAQYGNIVTVLHRDGIKGDVTINDRIDHRGIA